MGDSRSPHPIAFGKTNSTLSRDSPSKKCHEILQNTEYHQPNGYQTYSSFLIMGCSSKRTDRLMCHYISDTVSFTSHPFFPSLVPGYSLKESEREIKGKVDEKMLLDAAFLYLIWAQASSSLETHWVF